MAESLFTPEEQRRFDAGIADLLTHYPPDRKSAAMLPALRLLQSLKGWLPPEGLRLVARHLEVTPERADTPLDSFRSFGTAIEQQGFKALDVGGSAAQSVVLMAIVITPTVVQFRWVERRVQY